MDDKNDPNEILSPDQLLEKAKKGEIPVEFVTKYPTTFTPENFEKFSRGDITWGELQGRTLEESYAIAEMAYTLLEQGRVDDARILTEGLVMGNPYDPYFHTMLGAIYAKKNQHDLAIDEYTVALGLEPKNVSGLVNRGELFLQKGKVDEALADLKNAIELDPKAENPSTIRAKALAAAMAAIAVKVLDNK